MSVENHILIVEDDETVQTLLGAYLTDKRFRVTGVCSAAEMAAVQSQERIDLILLDLGLPDEDGLVVTRQLRAMGSTPIIVITAREEREDRIAALELGADDYLVKPFDPEELVLRINNMLARDAGGESPGRENSRGQRVTFAEFVLDTGEHALRRGDGSEIDLTPAEYNVLSALARASNRVLSRDHLLDAISRGADAPGARVIDVVISRLRKKLGDNPRKPQIILTVPSFGYRLDARRQLE